MMDYSKLSDMEINGRVLHAITNGKAIRLQQASVASGETDYCNNAADAWPIILQNRLYIDPIYLKDWCVTSECDSYREIHENPLRAAMICYLMMQESE
ncbi:phage protein NinX family protein [Erwinia aphidicola]|uniref:Phage protein NinX family protein n=1 Tax=Erwinia aphidicola TaxID=68334 RepID=A0ABU8DM48_ERWAP